MRTVGKNWTDRQMYDFILGNDPFPGMYDEYVGILACEDEPEVYSNATDMFEEIRENIFKKNCMDDPYAPMKPFQDRHEPAPGETYWLYDVYAGNRIMIVKPHAVSPKQLLRVGDGWYDEYFHDCGMSGIGDGWVVLLNEYGEVFEND